MVFTLTCKGMILGVRPLGEEHAATTSSITQQMWEKHDVYRPLIDRAKIQHHFLISFDLELVNNLLF